MRLITAQDYFEEMQAKIPHAASRIVLAAMILTWGPKTAKIFALLEDALDRGVDVQLFSDGFYSRLPIAFNEFWPGAQTRERGGQTKELFAQLEAKGANINFSRTTGVNPYRGAFHAKITIIDDDVYSFGGVNFCDEAFGLVDYMLHSHDADLADTLATLVHQCTRRKVPDVAYEVRRKETVLFDGGHKKESVIYQQACQLSADATNIWYVSQMCPSGKLAGLLRRTKSYCYFNRPSQSVGPNGAAIAVDQQRYRIKNYYEGNRYIHAKFMLFEYADGKKQLLSGSHNFSWRGVRYGSAEIALHSQDIDLWQQIYGFMQKEVLLR